MKKFWQLFTPLVLAFSMSLTLAGGTLIGGFDVGPGGDPQVALYQQSAGSNWLSKIYTPLVMMTSDAVLTNLKMS